MESKEKICFVVMPISDQDGYDKGHFTRVYQHLIKPACEKAGFKVIRADDEVKTNFIVVDILKKIVNSEMVICDLSSKNPNVLYELGLRQAFNKKVVLIKDNKTNRIFDIQGLRTLDYDENLRIDEVQKNIGQISKTLIDTYENTSEDINSLIQLLSMQPAILPSRLEMSQESSLILDSLNSLSNRLRDLEKIVITEKIPSKPRVEGYLINEVEYQIGDELFGPTNSLGRLVDVHADSIFLKKDGEVYQILKSDPKFEKIYPF